MKLYELPEHFRAWEREVDEAGGVTGELIAAFVALEATLQDKVDAIGWLIREAEADEEAYRDLVREFGGKAHTEANRSAGLRAYMQRSLEALGLDGARGRHFSVSIVKSGRPKITWPHGRDLPEGFAKTEVSLDGEAAQQAHRLGVLPEGFDVTFTTSLRLR